jgi:hypothetical protein
MSTEGEFWRDVKAHRQEERERLGVPCEGCKAKFPKANPKILFPGQKCFCGHTDPRKRERKGE